MEGEAAVVGPVVRALDERGGVEAEARQEGEGLKPLPLPLDARHALTTHNSHNTHNPLELRSPATLVWYGVQAVAAARFLYRFHSKPQS